MPRREALAALAAAVAVATPGEARAFLGFGEDQNQKYTDRTVRPLDDLSGALRTMVPQTWWERATRACRGTC